MVQIIVPTSNPGVTIVRGIGIWGSASSDHCEVRYDNVRVPENNAPARWATATGRLRTASGPGASSTA